jgi:hypothetical protein
MRREIIGWIIVTPRGKPIQRTLSPTRSEAVANHILARYDAFYLDDVENFWGLDKSYGYQAKRVTATVVSDDS